MTTATATTKPITRKALAEQERQEAIVRLRKVLKPGDTVHTILRHKARSGMFYVISLVVIDKGFLGRTPDIRCVDGDVCTVLGRTYNRNHDGVPIGGGGMDMGFSLVYNLSRALFPEGFKVPKGQHGRNGDTSGHDKDGGYALNHRWL